MSYADAYDPQDGIAIVALAGRFPGARDVEEFWENLVAGKETISHFAEDELEPSSPIDMEQRGDPSYVRARGILDGVELFDADFFKMSPREAEVTDPQQRVFLETAWEALERAGYDPETYEGSIGVYASMSNNTYFLANLHSRPDVLQRAGELPMLGNEKDYLATRGLVQAQSARAQHQRRHRLFLVPRGGVSGSPGPHHAPMRHGAGRRRVDQRSAEARLSVPGGIHHLTRRPLPRVRRAGGGDGLLQRPWHRGAEAARGRARRGRHDLRGHQRRSRDTTTDPAE